jgi:hypothetical protein
MSDAALEALSLALTLAISRHFPPFMQCGMRCSPIPHHSPRTLTDINHCGLTYRGPLVSGCWQVGMWMREREREREGGREREKARERESVCVCEGLTLYGIATARNQ